MKRTDRELGLDRRISRRNLLHGFGALAAGTFISGRVPADETFPLAHSDETRSVYPPARTGWRGNHVGSFETAHELAHRGRRDWQAWKKLRIGGVVAPGSYHTVVMLDFPVSLGNYSHAKNPDEPILVHMERFPHRDNEGLTADEQHCLVRRDMLAESFEGIKRNIRGQLAGLLSPAGFDPARDIAGICVNRWAHGYANWGNSLFSPTYADDDDDDERYPHMQARKRFGRIAIANSDAAATPMLEAAVEHGYRAVSELA